MTTTPHSTSKPRVRIFHLDLIRALATVIIVLTHFNNPFLTEGRYLVANRPFGVYIGDLGVSLFLIISGTALAMTYPQPFNLKRFYWKRFKGIYPMFWTAWLLGTLFFFIDMKGHPLNAAPLKSLVWTLLGIDGLVANFHVTTAYLLGEWFLGFIIIFYLVFPILSWGVDRYPVTTAALIGLAYLLTVFVIGNWTDLPMSVVLTTRLPELALGMYLVRYTRKVHPGAGVVGAILLTVFVFVGERVPKDIATTLVGICVYLVLVVVGDHLAIGPVRQVVSLIARYSYPIFLVHHVIIYRLFSYSDLDWATFNRTQLYTFFIAVCVLTLLLAIGLDRVTQQIVSFTAKGFTGQWWLSDARRAARTASDASGETETER